MPDLVVAGNWKMNTTVAEAATLAAGVVDGAAAIPGVALVLCPPFVSLAAVSDAVKGSAVKVGAQNMHFQDSGAFTGEVSPGMLQGLCDYVILGHSERRQMFAETDESVNSKVKAAQAAGLKPILCVGETLEEREGEKASDVISGQVRAGLEGISDTSGLIVAYEPIWAIGTGQAATPETAAEVMGGVILETLRSLFAAAADDISLLYGGSMNAANAGDYAAQDCIHGGLVGGAGLQAESFLQVAAAVAAAKA
ncbi:MAG: triose-phosphate isomerase [Chloroflexi bacterium]|nr:triose-phosphate isomerase [Chloroflexota bacterium]